MSRLMLVDFECIDYEGNRWVKRVAPRFVACVGLEGPQSDGRYWASVEMSNRTICNRIHVDAAEYLEAFLKRAALEDD